MGHIEAGDSKPDLTCGPQFAYSHESQEAVLPSFKAHFYQEQKDLFNLI